MPQQTNVYDCGIFMLKFLEHFLVKPPEFLRKTGTFLRWYPNFSISNTREEILKYLQKLCVREKWDAYLEYRRKDAYYTELIGDQIPLFTISLPEPEPLRRTVSECDIHLEALSVPSKKLGRRNSSSF
uniref:ULP_PROTEASE domain-containing protein n=1 Tax=Syphacia muris TaxID=451379 RepID=A0A0N5AYG1_9BILA